MIDSNPILILLLRSQEYDDLAVNTDEVLALREKLEATNKKLYIEKR